MMRPDVAVIGAGICGVATAFALSERGATVTVYAVGLADADRTAAYVAGALPGLDPTPVEARTCWVTELPWGHDGLAVWEAGALLFLAGNNLFKHAPALGHRLATGAIDDVRPEVRLGV
jgi:glycine/D-amino acid oxidase-like deaminating enzyme